MMRTPRFWAVAVRRPDGRISTISRASESIAMRHAVLRLPVIRGVVALGESLAIGFRALAISANYAASDDDDEQSSEIGKGAMFVSFAMAIGLAILLFKVAPVGIARFLDIDPTWLFLLVEGCIRVALFMGYLVALSFVPDLRRVFQYHAAEHKAINALEAGDPLDPAAVQRHSLIHLRCGTAFLLWVMVVAIFVFAFVGMPSLPWLIASRIVLVPVIAGLAYEVIRFAGKHGGNPLVRAVLAPGLWLQRLTTRPPTVDQIEVSIASLQEVLRLERERTSRGPQVEVMA